MQMHVPILCLCWRNALIYSKCFICTRTHTHIHTAHWLVAHQVMRVEAN